MQIEVDDSMCGLIYGVWIAGSLPSIQFKQQSQHSRLNTAQRMREGERVSVH